MLLKLRPSSTSYLLVQLLKQSPQMNYFSMDLKDFCYWTKPISVCSVETPISLETPALSLQRIPPLFLLALKG